ncbi:MAG: glycosyltransferase family 39 protein [Verrucomicrobia bacterium]|nr:glycosyltransferase family 39 protein [Verrucomicrobiota bacterium]
MFLALLALAVLLPGTARLPLLDRDEPRFSRATVEMIERSEWVVPYFNREYRFDKPVLTYWLMRAGYALCGRNELGARAHSVAATALLAIVVFAMGRRWRDARTGLAAAVMLLLSMQMLIHGRSAVADMPMVLCVALSEWALWNLLAGDGPGPRRGWWWMLWLSLGSGFLAKGPIAWLVPALSAVLFRWVFLRRPLPWRRLGLLPGLAVALAVIAPWGIAALVKTGGAFWKVGIGQHVVERGFDAFDGRRFVPFYYLPTAFLSLFPWIALLGSAWAVARRDRTPRVAFLLSWLAAPYLIFSFYSTQLPHYVLPGLPAFFLLLAPAAAPDAPAPPRWGRILRTALVALAAALAAVLATAAVFAPDDPMLGPLRPAFWAGAGILCALLLALHTFPRFHPAAIVGSAVLLGAATSLLAGTLRAVSPALALAPVVAKLPADAECLWHRFREPSVVFYTGRTWRAPGGIAEIAAHMAKPGPRIVIVTAEQADLDDHLNNLLAARGLAKPKKAVSDFRAENRPLHKPGYTHSEIRAFNIARGSWVTLDVFTRAE